jgi:hypothetical protein
MANNFMLQKLVGRVVPTSMNQMPMYAPGSGKACVYYKIEVEECWKVTEIDEETGSRSTREEWESICVDEQCRDFYLQDGMNKLFVNGSNRPACKIQAQEDDTDLGGWFSHKEPPPGVTALVGSRKPDWFPQTSVQMDGDMEMRRRTGEIRFSEKAFDVNELLACLGVPVPGTDPFTGQPIQMLQPFDESSLTDEYFEQAGWSDYEKKSWHKLLSERSAVLLSDNPDFTEGTIIQPLQNMQPWMIQPLTPQIILAQPSTYNLIDCFVRRKPYPLLTTLPFLDLYQVIQPQIISPVVITPIMPNVIVPVQVAPVILQPGVVIAQPGVVMAQPGVAQVVPCA